MSSMLLNVNFINRSVRYFNCRHGLGITNTYFKSLHVKPRSTSISETQKVQDKQEDYNISKIEAKGALKNAEFANRLRELTSVDGVLSFVDKQKFMESIDIGMTFRRLIEISSEPSRQEEAISISLSKDDRLARLATHVVDTDILLFVLTSLRQLPGIDPHILKSVETKVHDLLGQMSISQVVRVVKITGGVTLENTAANTPDMKTNSNLVNDFSIDISDNNSGVARVADLTLCDDALNTLERRWVEIRSPQDIVTLMYVIPNNANDRLWARLNERVLERSEVMSAKDLYRVLYVMARRRRRSDPVIRSVVYHMNKRSLKGESLPQSTSLYSSSANTEISQPDTSVSPRSTTPLVIPDPVQDTVPNASLTLVQLSNLAYACATLNIRDHVLLRSLVSAIISSFDKSLNVDNIHVYSSILQSLASLHWLDGDVMDRICSMFTSSADKVTVSQWSNLIMSSSSLGYLPSSLSKETLMSVFDRIRGGHQARYHRALLDIVWSAAVLNMITVEMAATVLNKDFVKSLESSSLSNPIPVQLKLLNIDAIVKHAMIAEYDGPSLDKDYINRISTVLNVRAHGVLKKTLLDTMNKMASSEKYLRVDVRTPAGYHIDVELFTNEKGQLQPVVDYTKVTSSSHSVLPSGIYRFAIKLLDASDMTLGQVQPTGINIICSRYLTAVGYKVIQIPHNELSDSTTIVKRVQYIHSRIMDGLRGTNTRSCTTYSVAEDKLNLERNLQESKQGKSDAGNVLQETGAESSLSKSGNNNNVLAAERISKNVVDKINKRRVPRDESQSNDVSLSSTRTDEKKRQQLKKRKPKSVSSHTSSLLDIRELYEEQSISVTPGKSTSVTDTKRRN